jgi:hypothetical protein
VIGGKIIDVVAFLAIATVATLWPGPFVTPVWIAVYGIVSYIHGWASGEAAARMERK